MGKGNIGTCTVHLDKPVRLWVFIKRSDGWSFKMDVPLLSLAFYIDGVYHCHYHLYYEIDSQIVYSKRYTPSI